jgi:hypothetical protein
MVVGDYYKKITQMINKARTNAPKIEERLLKEGKIIQKGLVKTKTNRYIKLLQKQL